VLGIAPDWARGVVLRVGSKKRTVVVRDNAYALHADVPIRVEKLVR
jgi:transposase